MSHVLWVKFKHVCLTDQKKVSVSLIEVFERHSDAGHQGWARGISWFTLMCTRIQCSRISYIWLSKCGHIFLFCFLLEGTFNLHQLHTDNNRLHNCTISCLLYNTDSISCIDSDLINWQMAEINRTINFTSCIQTSNCIHFHDIHGKSLSTAPLLTKTRPGSTLVVENTRHVIKLFPFNIITVADVLN